MGSYFIDGIEVDGNSKVTPIIDGRAFNEAVADAIAEVGTHSDREDNRNHFIYIANWWLGLVAGRFVPYNETDGSTVDLVDVEPYLLDGPNGNTLLIDVLREKAEAGVDVRVLGWASFALMNSQLLNQMDKAHSYIALNTATIKSIAELRDIPEIGAKAVINDIAHTAGAVHVKLLVIGNDDNAVGFTGGLDFAPGRWAEPGHYGNQTWHDVAAKVEGPGVQGLYDLFRDLYNENTDPEREVRIYRVGGDEVPSRLSGAGGVVCRAVGTDQTENHQVQNLRTLPVFRYARLNRYPENPPLSFAPDGAFEFNDALKHAIEQAETYIFIEDQSFWSTEILSWVNQAVKDNPDLKVILLASGGADPNDPAFPSGYINRALNDGLCRDLTGSQLGRVRLFNRMGDYVNVCPINITAAASDNGKTTTNITVDDADQDRFRAGLRYFPRQYIRQDDKLYRVRDWSINGQPWVLLVDDRGSDKVITGSAELWVMYGIVMHGKTVIIDDQWAQIGSANIMRRSQYTDIEHAVAFSGGDLVSKYRQELWSDHFRHPDPTDFADMHASLSCWAPEWGSGSPHPARPVQLEIIMLPVSEPEQLSRRQRWEYDTVEDVDSRDRWGGLIVP